jgi:hypothetical protein
MLCPTLVSAVVWLVAHLVAPRFAFAGQPLVVVAEATADAGLTSNEIRKAVTTELGEAVADNADERAATPDVLFIAASARRAVLVFCPNDPISDDVRRRTIELPDDIGDRRKTIAWIALNLVKNQVADLGGAAPRPLDADAPTAPPASVAPPSLQPPPLVPPSTEDARVGAAPTVTVKSDGHADTPSAWTIAAFGGYSMRFIGSDFRSNYGWAPYRMGTEWQIEATKRVADWNLGVALDIGEQDSPAGGVAGVIGDEWRRGRLGLEVTAGAGLELTGRPTRVAQTEYSTQGYSSSIVTSTDLRLRPYGRGNAALVWHAGRAADLIVRLALHVETDNRTYTYATALLGLRIRLP